MALSKVGTPWTANHQLHSLSMPEKKNNQQSHRQTETERERALQIHSNDSNSIDYKKIHLTGHRRCFEIIADG